MAPATASPRRRGGACRRLALTHHLRVGGLQVLACDEPPVAARFRRRAWHQLAPSCSPVSLASRRATTSGSFCWPGPAVMRQAATPITAIPRMTTTA